MEESTESHMETDVSSTTDDVPETQEVTGSDGNVEMIIVVEKMDDEPSADEEMEEEQPSLVNEDSSNLITPSGKSPENEIQVPKSPEKPLVKSPEKPLVKPPEKLLVKSPEKPLVKSSEIILVKSPEKPLVKSTEKLLVKSSEKSLVKSTEILLVKSPEKPLVKSPEKPLIKLPVKSPIKTPAKSSNIETEVPDTQSKLAAEQMDVETNPEKHDDVVPSVEKQQVEAADSSIKELGPIQSEEKPSQAQKSPKKDVLNPVQRTPVKDLQPLDSAKSTPTKESPILDKSPVNGKVQCNDTSKKDDTKIKTVTSIDITIETSNDSQIETMSDLSEKEHKSLSISRELKSLINSAKESKIISECTQLTSKTRKSRTALDTSSSSLNSSLVEPNRIHDTRRNSDISQKSNCSEKSDRVVLKRSMRSQNPEFVSKVKQFLNSVTGKGNKDSDDEEDELDSKDLHETIRRTPPKLKKPEIIVTEKSNKLRSDSYCWRCHWVVEQATNEKLHPPMHCTVCPRSFHYKCLTGTERNKINLEKNWVCPECMIVLQAESSETRSQAMRKISLGMLCDLLKHALERMMDLNGVEPFMQPVDRAAFPDYDKYVVHPMDLSLMKDNIADGLYGSTEAFLADAQWILHNSIIFNTLQSKLTAAARALVRSCRAEMGEIEACPECYAAAHARRPTWFTDVCTTPHLLFWAKLKGFPYWPAKGMSVNGSGLVDVRFFGAHDRAWVPAKDCFLYCEKDPNNFRTKRQDIIDSMHEAEQHIRNISRKYGRFVYPPFKTQFDPSKMHEQLKMMIPTFEGEVRSVVKEKVSPTPNVKSRSNSKSSKSSFNDGLVLHSDSSDSDGEELLRLYALLDKHSDTSDNEDTKTTARKMADGAEIAKIEDDDSSTLDKEMDTDSAPVTKSKDDSQSSTSTSTAKKRRRSELEEAVITIIESSGSSCSSTSEKRRKHDDEDKKTDENVPSSSKVEDKCTADKAQEDTNEATQPKTKETPPKVKDTDPRSNVEKDKLRVTPIRIALVTKEKRKTRNSSSTPDTTGKIITPNKRQEQDKEQEKTPQRPKSTRTEKIDKTPAAKTDKAEKLTSKAEKTPGSKSEKTPNSKAEKVDKTPTSKDKEKVDKTPSDKTTREDRSRSQKRRNSRSSRSTNSTSSTRSSDKTEKKSEKNNEGSSKDKRRESSSSAKDKDGEADKSRMEKQMSPDLLSPKTVKDRLLFDDDTTLAVLARETNKSVTSSNNSGLPTISCVRSLSTTAQITGVTLTKTTTTANTIDITEEATSDSSIFTPTSTENVKTMQDAVSKLQRLRNDTEPVVGRVGVRAFARMTSPERQANDEVQVEIKAEPIELDDADRHMEKMDLMNAFRLRPVNPQNMHPVTPPVNLRDVRINKVVVTPLNARKAATATVTSSATKTPEVRPRAKKTFPQPKKPEEGRSELNSKNSMVYIPIQPPMTQAPLRLPRPTQNVVTSVIRPPVTSAANNLVNTVTTPLMQASSPSTTTVTSSTSVATVPTVHTVPLMTSVNGQWMFSFQPVMSVGAIDSAVSPPMLNGIAERGSTSAPLATLTPSAAPGGLPAVSAPSAGPAPPITVLSRAPGANAADNTLGEPPRLQQRPSQFLLNPLDASTPIGSLPPPSTAGPVTAKLNQNAVKMTDFFRTLLEDSLEKLEEPWSQITTLRLQLEQDQWRHQQELKEVKHNHDLTLAEMRATFDKEKLRAVSEARRAAQVELEAAVKLAKSKQWCANCRQEAQFYCCWNTSYCDLPCQRAHWATHYSTCQQRSQTDSNGEPPNSPENRLQPQPDIMPKSTSAPTLTVGGKLAPTRVYSQDPHSSQKASIIVSMVEDTSGNQTMKCVGTYKPSSPGQMQPIIINKQIMNNEENANKKVVASSGGYLIVGGPNNSSVVTPARRTHTIQYYTS